MADDTGLADRLAELAASGERFAVPPAAERIRARGDRRLRRRRAAVVSGGTLLVAALAVGGLSLAGLGQASAPPTETPAPSASRFVPPTPAPGAEYASELGYVYDAVALEGDTVRVTVEQVSTERGAAVPTGVVHTLTLPGQTPVEVRHLADGEPADLRLGELVSRLDAAPRWVFAIDYDGEGRVQSLREAFWLATE
ncbi:hypothetical protein [Streptomyces profundus]|uniref:hypothetical protein n=1 Tax=Streptomyces profundus TaxID=2867410 RepID=UPI001D160BBE|nr:hypothetical protein [Streptomyces sp. MA3_2.13]UED86637.1 hypothetical protein K4G22_22580 [Streptomyces sp. MA3_2.13]